MPRPHAQYTIPLASRLQVADAVELGPAGGTGGGLEERLGAVAGQHLRNGRPAHVGVSAVDRAGALQGKRAGRVVAIEADEVDGDVVIAAAGRVADAGDGRPD